MVDDSGARQGATATRIFVWSGLVWQLTTSSYWTLFFIRVVIDVGLTPLELVLLGTAKEITILLVEIPTGVVADIRSRRLSVILGFVICGLAVIGAGFADEFLLLAATQVLWAFGSTFRSGAETAWFTDEIGSVDTVDRILPRRARFEAAGSIVGLLSAAVLASVVGLSITLGFVGAVLVAWGLLLAARMPETGFTRHPARVRSRFGVLLRQGLAAARRPALRVLLAVTVLAGFGSEAVDRLHVARLDEIGFPDTVSVPVLIGGAAVAHSIAAIVLLLILGRTLTGPRLVTAWVGLTAATGVGVLVIARADLLGLALVGVIAQGAARDVARTVTVAWTNHFTDSSNRATVHSFVGQALSLGEISGGVALGVLAQQTGISTALTASAVVYLLAALLATRGKSRWARPAGSGRQPAP
jgi:hypothetical protein